MPKVAPNIAQNSTKDFFTNAFNNLKISEERVILIKKIAENVVVHLQTNNKVNLTYICTYNSRRSQMSQVWSSYAAHYFDMPFIKSFSGGTTVTSFFKNTIKTLKKAGFRFQLLEFSHQNSEYLISYENCKDSIIGFSKMHDHKMNKKPFFSITNCDIAHRNCSFITDSIENFHLPFTDPKIYDYTLQQDEKYMEINKQIAGEIHFLFLKIKELI